MAGLLDIMGLGGQMPTLEDQEQGIDPESTRRLERKRRPGLSVQAGSEASMLNPPAIPSQGPQAGQPGYLPPTQGQGLPGGATPFPMGPAPAPQAPAGLLAGGAAPGATAVPTVPAGQMPTTPPTQGGFGLLENRPPAAAPQAPRPVNPTGPTAVPDLLGRVGNWLSAHSNQLMSMGAGIAGAPSIGQGISRGLAGAVQGQQGDISNLAMNATVKALMEKGVDPNTALAATSDPKIMQALIAKHFSQPTFEKLPNAYGGTDLVLTDAATGTAQRPTAVPPGTKKVNSFEEALALPKGTTFIDPEGVVRVR
jgi:hypothetical protein